MNAQHITLALAQMDIATGQPEANLSGRERTLSRPEMPVQTCSSCLSCGSTGTIWSRLPAGQHL
jgi:hypothetical protein